MRTLQIIKSSLLSLLLFIFPLFFLPITHEFYDTNKLFLLGTTVVMLVFLSTFEFIATKKIAFKKTPFLIPLLLFFMADITSILLQSQNKIQAVLNGQLGVLPLFLLIILYLYLAADADESNFADHMSLFQYSTFILSIITVIFYFKPFQAVLLPRSMQFLANPTFTPIGSLYSLTTYLGFFLLYSLISIALTKKHKAKMTWTMYVQLVTVFIALACTLSLIFTKSEPVPTIPSFALSLQTALQSFKSPVQALFGNGVDMYSVVFNKSKSISYNLTPFWQINSFAISRSAILQILTDTGIVGLFLFLNIFIIAVRKTLRMNHLEQQAGFSVVMYLFLVFVFTPLSLPNMFLFIVILSLLTPSIHEHYKKYEWGFHKGASQVFFYIIIFVSFSALSGFTYLIARNYLASYQMRQSLEAVATNNLQELYSDQRNAVILNPYIEQYRINFAQTNIFIAKQIAAKATNRGILSAQDRDTITQSIKAAINESKAAVALNPEKASNWENYGSVYNSLLNVAADTDKWALVLYQRAIQLDPFNATYHMQLGGILLHTKNYEAAIKEFMIATELKPDWSNAYYNLANAYFEKGDHKNAVLTMQKVIDLLQSQNMQTELKKAQAELQRFQTQK